MRAFTKATLLQSVIEDQSNGESVDESASDDDDWGSVFEDDESEDNGNSDKDKNAIKEFPRVDVRPPTNFRSLLTTMLLEDKAPHFS